MSDKIKVLVVDDEEVIHRLFRKMLAAEPYELLFSTNGEEGLELIREQRPKVIILDYRMMGMTGDELMTKLTDQELEESLVVMVSGHAVPDIDLTERNKSKLFAYFEKPFFEMARLKETIKQAAVAGR